MNTNYGHPAARIFDNQTVKSATDIVVLARGPDGKMQLWSSGDQRQASSLIREAGSEIGVKEFERT